LVHDYKPANGAKEEKKAKKLLANHSQSNLDYAVMRGVSPGLRSQMPHAPISLCFFIIIDTGAPHPVIVAVPINSIQEAPCA
jgi:hypothetical protein